MAVCAKIPGLSAMLFRIFKVWLRLAPFLIAFSRDRHRWILFGQPRLLTDEVQRHRARRLTLQIASLGPSFIKLAQVFAIRGDIVPKIYSDELATLHDRVPPFDTCLLKNRIQEELKKPIEAVFDRFDDAPLAAASLGQVHRAKYRGRDVIVKVLRPGVEKLVETDIRIVRGLLFAIEQLIASHKIHAARTLIDEFSRVIAAEMDFEQEAQNVTRFAALFRQNNFVIIPKVYREISTRRLLVMQYFDGFRVTEVEQIRRHKIDTDKLIEHLIEFYGQQILVHGYFHADPHPGNILIRPDGRIVLLDYGMVTEISSEFREDLLRAAMAGVRRDVEELIRSFYRLDLLEPDVGPATVTEAAHAILALHLDTDLSQRRIREITNDILNTFYHFPLRLPSNLVYILRTAVLIEGIGVAYSSDFNGIRISVPIIQGLIERMLGPAGWPTIEDRAMREAEALYALVKNMESVFARMDRDQLPVRLHATEIDGLEKFFSHLFRRMVMTVSGAALAIVSTIIYQREGNLVLLGAGLSLAFGLIAIVFLMPNPQRYPFRMRRARRARKMLW
jgi:ubiquinone biosynthesis protein